MEPLTPLETLCRIILRAREYEAQVPTDYDDGEAPENVDSEDEETLSVLDDSINTSVEEELTNALEDLADDELQEILAFAWVGQGTYDAADWQQAWALIIGSEAHGESDEASTLARQRVYIPMASETESLNAAVAAGIILFEAARQRRT